MAPPPTADRAMARWAHGSGSAWRRDGSGAFLIAFILGRPVTADGSAGGDSRHA